MTTRFLSGGKRVLGMPFLLFPFMMLEVAIPWFVILCVLTYQVTDKLEGLYECHTIYIYTRLKKRDVGIGRIYVTTTSKNI